MGSDYIIARENFKEAAKHVSAETDPVMFNLLYGLQSLTNQIEADFASLRSDLNGLRAKPSARKAQKRTPPGKQKPAKKKQKTSRRRS
jgi:hypothetical protein